ncbi:DUF4181 domain-containing protein [Pseudobacillus sp. 179-B 2D1 NHS]|uniref:DUF4181 domain-containing protein n=1 Tax=Pseudobacillus sp. 179-B 2D1 NHS TaxID=3374292 RepID=UPI00387974C9
MKFLMFIILLAILVITLEKTINKLLGVEKKRISETPAKNIDRWGKIIILCSFLCALWFVVIKDIHIIKWFWTSYFFILLGFQALLEWKYLKNSKQYVSTLIFLIIAVIIISNMEHFIQLMG